MTNNTPAPLSSERPVDASSSLDWIARRAPLPASVPVTRRYLPDSDGRRTDYEGVLHTDSHRLPDVSCPSHPGYG